jgi:hypothetical protein
MDMKATMTYKNSTVSLYDIIFFLFFLHCMQPFPYASQESIRKEIEKIKLNVQMIRSKKF